MVTAINVVKAKYRMARSPSFPNLLMSFIERIPAMMENSTKGTTMNFRRLRKMVPNGLMNSFTKPGWSCSRIPAMMASTRATAIWVVSDSLIFIVVYFCEDGKRQVIFSSSDDLLQF